MFEDAPDHTATGSESLLEFAHNAGSDHSDRAWLLDPRDVWVANPFYQGPPVPHPEDDSQHLDEGITPEPLANAISREEHANRIKNHEISEEDVPF
jgi:hypothetical protein